MGSDTKGTGALAQSNVPEAGFTKAEATGDERQTVIDLGVNLPKDDVTVRPVRLNGLEKLCLGLLRSCVGEALDITMQVDTLPGTPDFVLGRGSLKVAVMVDGLFWHNKGGRRMERVALRFLAEGDERRAHFWKQKSSENESRDRRVNKELRELGYVVVRLKEARLSGVRYEAALAYVSRSLAHALRHKF